MGRISTFSRKDAQGKVGRASCERHMVSPVIEPIRFGKNLSSNREIEPSGELRTQAASAAYHAAFGASTLNSRRPDTVRPMYLGALTQWQRGHLKRRR